MLYQEQAVLQNPALPHQVLSSIELYGWDSTTTDHRGFFCFLHLSYFILPKAMLPAQRLLRARMGCVFSILPFPCRHRLDQLLF